MKARRVKGVDAHGAMADGLEKVVRVRADLRIAAKRLRYALEISAEPCFGPYATTAVKRCRELQDLLGELHDCDVALPRVRELQAELRTADALEARARAGDAEDLRPVHASGTPHAQEWRGLEALRIYYQARRGLLFERFLDAWRALERDGFGARLDYALRERPAFTSPSRDGHAGTRESAT